MLPTKLILSAFGSYPGRTEIPLEKLGRRGVYLITGETGAGKTTIFDAITFALYDTASGGKDKQLLRSQYAEPDTPTFVDLYFDHKDVRYRFLRYLAPKSGGKLPPGAKELRIYTIDDDNVEKCINLNCKVKENKALVNDILGVDYDQFRQVAMLAQGDFFRLVETKSGERRAIFSTIFDTSVFARIEDAMKEENRAANEKVNRRADELRACIDALTENAAHAEELSQIKEAGAAPVLTADCTARAIAAAREITEEDALELEGLKKDKDALNNKISSHEKLIAAAEEAEKAKAALAAALQKREALGKESAAAAEKLAQASSREQDIKSFRETAAVEEKTLPKYRELTSRLEKLAQVRAQLSDASGGHAKAVRQLEQLRSRRAAISEKLSGLAAAEQELLKASNERERAESRLDASKKLAASFSEMKTSRRRVTAAQDAFIAAQRTALQSAREHLSTCMAAAHSAQEDISSLEAERERLTRDIAAAETELEKLSGCEGEAAARSAEQRDAGERLQKLVSLRHETLEGFRSEQAKALSHYEKTAKARAAKLELDILLGKLSDAYHRSAAWKLTSELEDGKPCPVCGSLHHPAPAKKPDSAPDKADVDKAREKLDAAAAEYEALDAQQRSLDNALEAKWAVIRGEAQRLTGSTIEKETAEQTLDESILIHKQKADDANAALLAAQQALNRKRELQKSLADSRSAQQKLTASFEAAKTSLGKRTAQRESVSEAFGRLVSGLPERAERCTGGGEVKLRADVEALFDTHFPPDVFTGERVSDSELDARKERAAYAASESDEALSAAYNEALNYSGRRNRFAEQFRRHLGSEIDGRAANALGEDIAAEETAAEKALEVCKNAELEQRRRAEEKKRLTSELAELEKAIEKTEEEKNTLASTLSRLEEAESNEEKGAAQLKGELPYENEAQVEEHIGRLRADAESMQQAITSAQARCNELGAEAGRLDGSISRLRQQLEENPAKDSEVRALREELEKLTGERKSRDSLMVELNTRLSSNKRLLGKLIRGEELRAREQEEADTISLLYRTMAGSVSGREKLDLETFVQLHYFDTVIANANERLKFMTNGQYELKRRGAAGDLRSRFGLDLNIVDYFCADPEKRERDVTSISGGEKFKVSLALALGLSDEIMRRAGAVRFDTLFVDEGFGSLDGESLQLALEVLDELSSADDRLIGIISHVEALKYSIDRQLVVKKSGGEGSRIEIR